jgi:hypothetical protein
MGSGGTEKRLAVTEKRGLGDQKVGSGGKKRAQNASLICSNFGSRKIQNSIAYKAKNKISKESSKTDSFNPKGVYHDKKIVKKSVCKDTT